MQENFYGSLGWQDKATNDVELVCLLLLIQKRSRSRNVSIYLFLWGISMRAPGKI